MTLVLNDEHRLLQQSAREFFTTHAPVSALRELRDNAAPDGLSRALWAQMVELGWAGMLLPEAYGGVDFGAVGLGIVMEEGGRTLAATPMLSTVALASRVLLNAGSEAQKKQYLPKIASGAMLATLAMDEGAHHTGAAQMSARKDADGYLLDGNKTMVIDGHIADLLIVPARIDGGQLALFLVESNTPGITRTRTTMVDSRNLANIEFQAVAISHEQRIGAAGSVESDLEDALDVGRAALAAEMLGGLQEAFERTVAYLQLREQFGKKIGTFQALQHRASVLFGEVELAKSVVIAALSGFDEKANDTPALASLAKAKTAETFQSVTQEAIQMHGGIGMTDEEEIGFYLKRARVCEQLLGTQRFHRSRYAQLNGF
ncbi:MAG: acyl-CoA/acyl-ACP dehydrogenase [Gammaproteobacteria bacterium]|nr:acyl-CoA/acyl-ACP dehydrogenase [Gammaproteobacteria bacterium]